MKIGKQSRRKAKALFRDLQANGVLDENRLLRAVQLIATEKPRGYLGMLTHLQHLTKLDVERRTARIETAARLDADMETKLRSTLTRRYGEGLQVSFHVNPALLGGLRIRVGSDVYDGTVASR